VEYLAGDQRGYEAEGLHHRRHILYAKSRYWFVVDDLRSSKTGDTLSWYFHSPTTLQPLGRGYSSTAAPGISILPALPFNRREGKGRAASTTVTTPGASEEINWISFDQPTRAGTIQRFPVLLRPYRVSAPVVRVSETVPGSYTVVDGECTDHIIVPSGQGPVGDVFTDASMVVLSRGGPGGNVFELIDGTFLQVGEKTVFRSPTRTSVEGEWVP
jgi:hypothetical protein